MKFILGTKLKMSQIFDKEGNAIPVTEIQAGPCFVLQVKDGKKDGYSAVQIGFGEKKRLSKALKSHMGGLGQFRWLREFRLTKFHVPSSYSEAGQSKAEKFKVGKKITVDIFKKHDKVQITGTSKGKGFQGVVKRWGFSGKSATHGTKHAERTPGSIGDTGMRKVWKGKKMPGRMGHDTVTVSNLKVIEIDKENNILKVKGAMPGIPGGLLKIVAEY